MEDDKRGAARVAKGARAVVVTALASQLELAPRAAQVLALIGEGHDRSEIAIILSIRASTVQTYLDQIFDALDARGAECIVVCADRQALKLAYAIAVAAAQRVCDAVGTTRSV